MKKGSRFSVGLKLVFVVTLVSFIGSTACLSADPRTEEAAKKIAKQWTQIKKAYPEAAEVIAQSLLYMATPLPKDREGFQYTSGFNNWKVDVGHCAVALLFATRLPDTCMVDVSRIKMDGGDVELGDTVECIQKCWKEPGRIPGDCPCRCDKNLCK